MKRNIWWILGIVAIILFLFAGGIVAGGWGFRNGHGMMGGYGMMGNWGYFPLGWLGMGIGMVLMWGIPLGLIALAGFGLAALVQSSNKTASATPQSACPNCTKNIQPDWQNCPYCGTSLK